LFVNTPVPFKVPLIASEPLFVTVPGLVTVRFAMAIAEEPLRATVEVTVSVPVMNTVPPLFVMLPFVMMAALLPERVPPESVTGPVSVFAPALFRMSDPFEMVVEPFTVKGTAAVVMEPPEPETVREPFTVLVVAPMAHAPVPP
jgi:hypothetical protein